MKKIILLLVLIIFTASTAKADNEKSIKTVFSKKDILKLSDVYIKNNAGVINPVMTDVDKDGDFDILDFTSNGKVVYYKNSGTLENPDFILENKNFDNYELNSFMPNGIPMPLFLADNDGDKDYDLFGIVKSNSKYKTLVAENVFGLDNYTLITIILVLIIIVLVLAIL